MITSVSNETIKSLKKLIKQRDIICLDNPKLITEALKNNWQILAVLKSNNIFYTEHDILVSENVLRYFSNVVTSQGVVAIVRLKIYDLKPPNNNFLVLDNVQDPGNVGTLIRSAVGANFLDIFLINCASISLDKTVRSTMGALFKCRFYEVKEDFIKILENWNMTLIVADMDGDSVFEYENKSPVGLIVGNEGHGVGESLKKIANKFVKIPMQNGLESLNAGVSGSIIMYQLTYGGKNVRS